MNIFIKMNKSPMDEYIDDTPGFVHYSLWGNKLWPWHIWPSVSKVSMGVNEEAIWKLSIPSESFRVWKKWCNTQIMATCCTEKYVFSARIFFGVPGDSLGQVTRCHNWIILHGLAWRNNGMMVLWIFHSYVSLPEGKPPFSYGFPMVFLWFSHFPWCFVCSPEATTPLPAPSPPAQTAPLPRSAADAPQSPKRHPSWGISIYIYI